MASTSNQDIQALLIIPEKHIQYRWKGFNYDLIEVEFNHPDFCNHYIEIDRETEHDWIQTERDIFEYCIRYLVLEHNKIVFTKGL